jgi:putative transposase
MRIRRLNHSTYQHQYHIVWGTKGRRKIIKDYVLAELKHSFYETCKKYPTLWIEACNANDDHVHLQIEIPPNIAVSDAVSKLKSLSSHALQKRFKFIRDMYLEKDGIWSVGYFSSTVGLDEARIRRYIDWQGKQDKPQKSRLF